MGYMVILHNRVISECSSKEEAIETFQNLFGNEGYDYSDIQIIKFENLKISISLESVGTINTKEWIE